MAQHPSTEAFAQGPSKVERGIMADETQLTGELDWEPSRHQKAIIYTIGVLNLIVALDASIIVTSLAVSVSLSDLYPSP